jgi:hypothetical protein
MSSVNPSEQILNLFNEYRENESANEQLKVQLRQNNVACENLHRSLNLTMDTVAKLEFDHQQLRKVAVESPSSKNLTDIDLYRHRSVSENELPVWTIKCRKRKNSS